MSNIEKAIDNFVLWELGDINDKWLKHYAKQYINDYWTAFDNFNNVKAAQDKKDQTLANLKVDLAVAALTICGGSVLAVVLGELAHMKTPGKMAMDALCRANMDEIFQKAKLVTKRKKVLEYSIGSVWKEILGIADQEARRVLENEFIGTDVQQSFIEKPKKRNCYGTLFD